MVVLRRGQAVDVFVILVGLSAFIAGALRVAAALVFRRLVDSPWLTLAGAGAMIAGLVLLLLPPRRALLKIVLSGYLCYSGSGELLAGVFGRKARAGSFAGARLG